MKQPKSQHLILERTGAVIATELVFAKSFWSRFKGLLGRSGLRAGEALWIEPCNSIHTFFMGFAIDAAFLDSEGKIVRIASWLKPWRATRIVLQARTVVEFEAGVLSRAGVEEGDRVRAEPATV